MSLQECKQKHTEREYRAWQAWLDDDPGDPFETSPSRGRRPVRPALTKTQATKIAKANWSGRLGMGEKDIGSRD